MKVVIVCHHALPHIGGVEVLVDQEVRALAGAGHEVVLITSDGTGPGAPPTYPDRVRVVRVPAWHGLERRFRLPYPVFSLALLACLWREVGRCDCVHVHGFMFMNSTLALVVAWLLRRPAVLTDHGGIQQFDCRLKSVLARLGAQTVGRLSARLATRLVAYNTRVLDLLGSLAGDKGKALFLANPVDRARFHPPTAEQRRSARARLGWAADRLKVLFVGRLVPEKGVPLLLAARDAAYDLVFCGPGDPAALGAPPPDGVEYFPPRPQPELVPLYQAADLLVLPSGVREGFPLAIQEALASGLPAVTCYDPGYAPYRCLPGLSFCAREPADVRRAIRAALALPHPHSPGQNGTALAPPHPHSPGQNGAALRELCPPLDVWLDRLYEGVVGTPRVTVEVTGSNAVPPTLQAGNN
jgi:glycosyltransferase involved in cell wall biosynthesis